MKQDTPQPITHSLLRNSQVRKKQQQSRPNSAKKFIDNQIQQKLLKLKQNFNYSQSLARNQNVRQPMRHGSSYTPHNRYPVTMICSQKIVVCNQLPHTKAKYTFNLQQPPLNVMINKSRLLIREEQNQSQKVNNIRRDMDYCIYNISDKLKQLKEKGNKDYITQINNVQNINQRPTLSQLRKNNKLFLDKSIHRIQPQLLNRYIQTIYHDYNIPDPLKQTNLNNLQDKRTQTDYNIKLNQNNQRVSFSTDKSQILQNQQSRRNVIHVLNQSNSKIANKNRRQNNLINHKQKRKENNCKKRFLNLTLSEQKPIQVRIFQSPIRKVNPQQDRIQKNSAQRNRQLRQSNSQKKILQIKKNISSWKDNEHQFAERYSYLRSPYQVLGNKTLPQKNNVQEQYTKRQVNIRVRPFQELMRANYTIDEVSFLNSRGNYQSSMNNYTLISQQMQSQYRQSFFTQTGQVMQEFRYCVLCEQPVLSVNISKHQEKCVGWVHRGKLYTFKDLYNIQKEEEVSLLMKNKITQIKKNISHMIDNIKDKQKQGIKCEAELGKNIIQTIQNYIESYAHTQLHPQNLTALSSFNQNYKKVQSNFKNQYLLLLQQSNKFCWFVKLLKNYQLRLRQLSRSLNQKSSKANKKLFQSTKQRNNNSQTFVQQDSIEQQQPISEFQGRVITQQGQLIKQSL